MKRFFSTMLFIAIFVFSGLATVYANTTEQPVPGRFLPETFAMPRDGRLVITGERLQEYLSFAGIEDDGEITKIVVSLLPSLETENEIQDIEPHFSSFEVRNVVNATQSWLACLSVIALKDAAFGENRHERIYPGG